MYYAAAQTRAFKLFLALRLLTQLSLLTELWSHNNWYFSRKTPFTTEVPHADVSVLP